MYQQLGAEAMVSKERFSCFFCPLAMKVLGCFRLVHLTYQLGVISMHSAGAAFPSVCWYLKHVLGDLWLSCPENLLIEDGNEEKI